MTNAQTPIDMTVAYRMARGRNKRVWLQQMLSPDGLDMYDYAPTSRAWTFCAGLEAFADDLAFAGYAIQELQTGPFGRLRIFITGYVPAAAPLLAAIRAKAGGRFGVRFQTTRHCELLAWVEHAAPEVVDAAVAIAPWFTGSTEELFAVAPGIALAPGRR